MKKIIAFILSIIIGTLPVVNAKELEPANNDIFKLNCRSAILIEASTGKIIYEYNSHEKLPPASVTKVMTMLLTMEAIDSKKINLNDKVTCSARAKSMGGSTMFLEEGEVRSVEDLIKGVSIESANDAAVSLAEYVGGTEEGFIEKMNARAKELGMNDTHFASCTGLDTADHYTSANDIALMSREILNKHSGILKYSKTWMETISEGRKEKFTLVNRNKMIRSYNGCDGLKTGFTEKSKYCISSTAKRGNIRFIAVIMGAPSWKERNQEAARLLDYGFSKYESVNVVKKDESVGELSIPKSKPEKVKVYAKDDLNAVFEKGTKKDLQKSLELSKNIKLPVKNGDVVGKVKVSDGSNDFGYVDAIVHEDIKKLTFGDVLKKVFGGWMKK